MIFWREPCPMRLLESAGCFLVFKPQGMEEVLKKLEKEAVKLGAQAVIGVQAQIFRLGPASKITITLIGTAIKFT